MRNRSCERWRHRGLTLIEVVASIALLSVLLVSSLVAFARHQRQLDAVEKRRHAMDAANSLMTEWFASPDPLPLIDSGRCAGSSNLIWRARPIRQVMLGTKPVNVVELSIFDRIQDSESLFSLEYLEQGERP